MIFRRATKKDIDAVSAIYEDIHTEEESGRMTIGWIRGVYPVRATAEAALQRGDLFVGENKGKIFGTAIINKNQVDVYADGKWSYDAPEKRVMVLHTLVISPEAGRKGYGSKFVRFYEDYAAGHGCPYLRMDTNARNVIARSMYYDLAYDEVGIVPCAFNGIEGVQLVLLEKKLTLTVDYDSPVGKLTLASEDGQSLSGLWLEGQKYYADTTRGPMRDAECLSLFTEVREWLDEYFAGKETEIGRLPLAPEGSPFRQAVWNILCEIPYGKTITYGEIASRIAQQQGKSSMSAQAVGGAVGHNPISIIIPCHRVMGSDGSLTGYAGGVDKKKWLLRHEGVIR